MSRVVTLLAAVSVLCALPFAAATDAPRGKSHVIDADVCSGVFLLPLRWSSESGRSHKLVAVFDTGASNAYIDPDSLEKASGKRIDVGKRVMLDNVDVGGLPFSSFKPTVRELDHLGRALGRDFDVFLPFHTFDNYLLTLDYDREKIRLTRGQLPEPDGVEVFSTRGKDRRTWLKTRIGNEDRRLLIDSGSNGSMSVSSDADVQWVRPPAAMRAAQGIRDIEVGVVGRFDGSIRIGPLDFENPIVSLTEETELIGYDVLRHFVLTFDQVNRRVRLQPVSEQPVTLPPRTGTGALLRPRPDALEVAHVIPGSPAALAGVKEGDGITHINGVSVLERGCRSDERQTGPVELTVRRGDRILSIATEIVLLVP